MHIVEPIINQFKVGCNFDPVIIEKAAELNEKYKGKAEIKEWFGSDAQNHLVTARPKWRLPDISKKDFEKFVRDSLDKNIVFNYTMNSIQPYGSKKEMVAHKKEIQDLVKYLESIGVYRITFANPMMAMFIREVSDIELELSTIAHLDTVTQIKYFHETLGVNKFCGNIQRNRDRDFLINVAKYCNENNIIFESLCNEFCYVAGPDYATHCPYRDSCYLCHATNVTKEDSMSYDNYPMHFCMSARDNHSDVAWLRSRWIRPEDLSKYNKLGLYYWKISGRTGSVEYVTKMMEAYMSQNWEGNLLNLWKPLQTIYSGKLEFTEDLPIYIDNKKLDGFIDHWMDKNFECSNVLCGKDCTYCKDFFEKNIK
jgi:collagenase-like PrtC family protease